MATQRNRKPEEAEDNGLATEKPKETSTKDKDGELLSDASEVQEKKEMTILEAFELAKNGRTVRRKGWSRAIKNGFVVIKRGETKPSFTAEGKYFSPYHPSIEDVMAKDWEEII